MWIYSTNILDEIVDIPRSAGNRYYVNGTIGDDNNNGLSPENAFKTPGYALTQVVAGDIIDVHTGTYIVSNFDLNLDSLELKCDNGVIFQDPAGTVLTISGKYCRVKNLYVVQGGQVGVHITLAGEGSVLENVTAISSTVGFDIDAFSAQLINCVADLCTVTSFDFSQRFVILKDCFSSGSGAATRGFYASNSNVTNCLLENCRSVGNATAGFEFVTGTTDNTIAVSSSGGEDGTRIDNGTNNSWPGFVEQLSTEHHEYIYPVSTGQGDVGDPVTVSNLTTNDAGGTRDDKNYWGDVTRLIPISGIPTRYYTLGIYIYSVAIAKIQQWEIFFALPVYCTAQNGGNAWDQLETVLTVADGTLVQNGDFVWITGDDRPDGEVLIVSGAPAGNVVTIASETRASGSGGIRYDYSITPANNKMYLLTRVGSEQFSPIQGDYSAPSAREHARYIWHEPKRLDANSAMLIRTLNATDDLLASMDVRAIYET